MVGVSNTLKIFFPGRRYSCDRSFLYFLDKYISGDSIYLTYDHPRMVEEKLTSEDDFKRAYAYAKEKLSNIDFKKYGEIIFIAKSLGTVVAGRLRKELGLENRVRFICLTPINKTLPYLTQTDFIITSESDKYIDVSSLKQKENMYPFLTIYKDVPHSLELPSMYETLNFLKVNLDLALNYLDTSYKDILDD